MSTRCRHRNHGRNIGPVDPNADQVRGISSKYAGEWIDNVVFGDAHAELKMSPVVITKYGSNDFRLHRSGYAGFAATVFGDYLFGENDLSDEPDNVAGADADMIHEGDEKNGQ